MRKAVLKALFLLIIVLSASPVFSQIPGIFGRYEIGYGLSTCYATYNGAIQTYDTTSKSYKNVNGTRKLRSLVGFQGTADEYIPLKRLGRKSELALSIAFMYDAYVFANLSLFQNGDSSFADPLSNFTGVSAQIGMPIGLDFKFGCDAFCVKNYRWCATLGAGVFPNLNATAFQDVIGTGFGVNPYIKAEGGIRWGLVWKLRALLTFGNSQLISKSNTTNFHVGDPANFTLTQNATLSFSLIIMPFAPFWRHTGFWDQKYRG